MAWPAAGPAFPHFAGIPAIMRRFPFARLLLLALLSSPLAHAELPETDWLELMPPADRKALEEMPDIIHDTRRPPAPSPARVA